MSLIDRGIDGLTFVSAQLGAVLQRRLREATGLALISLAMVAALALATWSVQDPSLSHATDAPVHNLLGKPGAIIADLLMQLFGLGGLALLLPIAVWGYRLLGHRPLNRERLRIVVWLLGAVLSAAFASCLPRSPHWPLPSGLGGVVGDAILRLPAVLLHVTAVGRPTASSRESYSAWPRWLLSRWRRASSGTVTRRKRTRMRKKTKRKKPRTRMATTGRGSRLVSWRMNF